ncbi:MAG: bifunctional adenosylcobinamide kinase/adenosylcobinamide-phosphate guanylyltransferase [Clostridia bacterium]|nr:bifunctional adenosylcobinamide kinase/adenosylcobinamide-phosphate guanylyltransferase [Clostridia bacterium]
MILIIGGRYQGKLDFARERFALSDGDILVCDEGSGVLDFDKRCLAYLDRYALGRVRAGEEPVNALKANMERLSDAVLITTDISCGVVPVDPVVRAWRDACGRMNNCLARQADEVWRLFCGIPQRLK